MGINRLFSSRARSVWLVALLVVGFAASAVPSTVAHSSNCSSQVGSGDSTSCGVDCDSGKYLFIQIQANDQWTDRVEGTIGCGDLWVGCSSEIYIAECVGGTTKVHDDNGTCTGTKYGDPFADNGLQLYCEVRTTASGASAPERESCDLPCMGKEIERLRALEQGASMLDGPVHSNVLFMIGSVGIGFACTEGGSSCVEVTPACSLEAEKMTCGIGGRGL